NYHDDCTNHSLHDALPLLAMKITIVIEMMAPISKAGMPNSNGVGSETMGPSSTAEKSAMPIAAANNVPMSSPSRIDSREMLPCSSRLSARTTSSVNMASPMLLADPQSGADSSVPMIQPTATGSREIPMTVMIVP